MAFGKVARRTVVADVNALLNSPELSALVADLDESGDKRGRKGYGARALLGACLVKSMFALPTWTFVAALIAEHPGLQDALGGCPSVWGKQTVLPIATGGRLFPRIARHTERFRKLYSRRALIEKEFAHCKREHGLAVLRVRGLERVQLHVDLTLLARLAVALNRTQEVALAA